jgi:hypothetical protein
MLMILIYWTEAYVPYKTKKKASIVVNEKTGLEVSADTTKYIVMWQDKNAGGSLNIKTDK